MSEEDSDDFEEFRIHADDDDSVTSFKHTHSAEPRKSNEGEFRSLSHKPSVTKVRRRKRSIVVSDRKVRSADVGVSGLYEVLFPFLS